MSDIKFHAPSEIPRWVRAELNSTLELLSSMLLIYSVTESIRSWKSDGSTGCISSTEEGADEAGDDGGSMR